MRQQIDPRKEPLSSTLFLFALRFGCGLYWANQIFLVRETKGAVVSARNANPDA
jgi:hypothetical protein